MTAIFIILIVLIVVQLLAGRINSSKEYQRGRKEGWVACKNMVLDRASEHRDYSLDKVREDLIGVWL